MAITVTAGTAATAAAFNAQLPVYSRQASDQPLGTTTFTNHNTFSGLTIGANETWHVVFCLNSTAADIADDIKVRLESTGTVTLDGFRNITGPGLTSTSSADVAGNFQGRALTDSVSGGSTTSATVLAVWREEFVLLGGLSGGTWGVEWAQQAATVGNTTVKAGSFLIMHRVS